MLQPCVRRTWAPRGVTPIHRSWDRHDRTSAISALTVSPERRHVGLYFSLQRDNFHGVEVVRFMRRLQCQLGKKLLLVWDRLNVHRAAAKALTRSDAITVEWLPPYAPDINPVEAVWCHAKYVDMANLLPADIDDLECELMISLALQRTDQTLLRSYFAHADLPL